ncbi:MAG: O-antigen ligase family protein [Granulosicoccus sp.]|nr:O-antigen ligase family protein [Granulosicoccus sp.]
MNTPTNIQNRLFAHLDVIAVVTLVAVVYLNVSDILIKQHGLLSINKTMVPAMLVLAIFYQFRSQRLSLGLVVSAIASLLYFGYQSSSVLYAEHLEFTQRELDVLLKNLIIMVTVVGLTLRVKTLELITWALLGSAAFISVLSILAYLSGDISMDFGGLHRWSVDIDLWGRVSTARIGGQIGDPNFFGQVLLLVLPMGLMFAFNGAPRGKQIAAAILSGTIIVALVCTMSRGSWLMLIAMLAVFAAALYRSYGQRNSRIRFALLGIITLALLSTYFLPEAVKSRFGSMVDNAQQVYTDGVVTDGAISGRIDEMAGALYAFAEHPFLGLGLNNFKPSYQDYSRRMGLTARGRDRSAHSLYLQLLAENGAIGLLLFLTLVYVAIRSALYSANHLRSIGSTVDAYYIYGFLYGYVAYLSAAVFLHSGFPRYFWLITGILIATLNLVPVTSLFHKAPKKGVHNKESMA